MQAFFWFLCAAQKIILYAGRTAIANGIFVWYNIKAIAETRVFGLISGYHMSARGEAGYRSRFRFWRPGVRIPPGGPRKIPHLSTGQMWDFSNEVFRFRRTWSMLRKWSGFVREVCLRHDRRRNTSLHIVLSTILHSGSAAASLGEAKLHGILKKKTSNSIISVK